MSLDCKKERLVLRLCTASQDANGVNFHSLLSGVTGPFQRHLGKKVSILYYYSCSEQLFNDELYPPCRSWLNTSSSKCNSLHCEEAARYSGRNTDFCVKQM